MQSLDGGQPGTACFLSLKDLGLPPGPGACVSSGGQGWPSLQHGTLREAARGREPKGGSNPNYAQSLKRPPLPPPGPELCAPEPLPGRSDRLPRRPRLTAVPAPAARPPLTLPRLQSPVAPLRTENLPRGLCHLGSQDTAWWRRFDGPGITGHGQAAAELWLPPCAAPTAAAAPEFWRSSASPARKAPRLSWPPQSQAEAGPSEASTGPRKAPLTF